KWTSLDVHGRTETVVNQLMRFGYGSAGGLLLHAIDGRVRHRAVMLFALMWGGEVALLRAVGAAPPPWRWKRATLVTSITQHVIYAYVADRAYRALQTNPPVPTLLVDPDEHTSTRRTSNGRASFDDER
ncbi:MAG: hypothetical protein ABIQ39_09870, partial [Ilumatobacteraceae bacterium]